MIIKYNFYYSEKYLKVSFWIFNIMYKNFHNIFKKEEKLKKDLSKKSRRVYGVIIKHWPVNPTEVAEKLGKEVNFENRKSLSSKYLYHIKKLFEKDLIHMKKIGNTYVAWPKEIEKIRTLYELITHDWGENISIADTFKKILLSGAFSVEKGRIKLFGDMDWSLYYSKALASTLQSIGEEKGEEYLYNLGYRATKVGGRELKDKVGIKKPGWPSQKIIVEMLDFLGYGKVDFVKADINNEGYHSIILHVKHNPTAEAAKDMFGEESMICGFFRGVYSAHGEMELGLQNPKLLESKCITKGDSYCEWKTEVRKWLH